MVSQPYCEKHTIFLSLSKILRCKLPNSKASAAETVLQLPNAHLLNGELLR